MSDLELHAKHIKYQGDLSLKFLERFYNRTAIFEQKGRDKYSLHLHGRTNTTRLCIRMHTSIPRDAAMRDDETPMLIRIGEFLKVSGPLTTFERLELAQYCLVFGRNPAQLRMLSGGRPISNQFVLLPPLLWPVFNRKLRTVLDFSRIQEGKFMDQVIKRGPQVINGLTDQDIQDWWNRWIRIDGQDRNLRSANVKIGDSTFKLDQMLISPSYSRESIIKGWLRALGVGHGA